MLWSLLTALAADPLPTPPPVHVHVDSALTPAQIRRIQRQLGAFVAVPTVDLLQQPQTGEDSWQGIQARLDALATQPLDRSEVAWVALRRELEELRRQRPPVIEHADLETRLQLEVWILRAAEGSNEAGARYEAGNTIAHLLSNDRTLLDGFEGADAQAELLSLADGAATLRRHPVKVGDVEGVRWLGTVIPAVDGVVTLPEGQWDLVGLRAGSQPGWSTRVQIGGPVDVGLALDRVVQEELRPVLAPGDCHPLLPPAAVARFNVPDRSGIEHFVAQENLLFRVDEQGVHRIDRRCKPAPGAL